LESLTLPRRHFFPEEKPPAISLFPAKAKRQSLVDCERFGIVNGIDLLASLLDLYFSETFSAAYSHSLLCCSRSVANTESGTLTDRWWPGCSIEIKPVVMGPSSLLRDPFVTLSEMLPCDDEAKRPPIHQQFA
jgi:hypothetical protein